MSYRNSQTGRWSGASSISKITRYGSDVVFDPQGQIIGGSHLPAETFSTVSGAAPSDMTAKTVTFNPNKPPAGGAWDPWTFPTTLPAATDLGQQQWTALDVNGDGLDDSIATVYHGPGHPGTTDLVIHINRGDGTFRNPVTIPTNWAYWYPAPTSGHELGQTVVAGDFNGDGRKDLMGIWADDSSGRTQVKAQVAFGSPDITLMTLGPVLTMPVATWANDHRWLVGDQDGDGRDDLIVVERVLARPGCSPSTNRFCTSPQIHVLRSDGHTFTELPQQHPNLNWTDAADETPYWFTGDINGDGRADIIRIESVFGPNGRTARIGIARSTGAGSFAFSTFATQVPWEPLVFSGRFGWRPIGADMAKVGDFDGNGLTDILIFAGYSANTEVDFDHLVSFTFLSQGSGLTNTFDVKQQDLSLSLLYQNNYSGAGGGGPTAATFPNKWFATDVNRDGVTDLVLVTSPTLNGGSQQTLIDTLVSNRDGTFGYPDERTVDVPFQCWNVGGGDCDGGPMFDVTAAELNGDSESDLLFSELTQPSGVVELFGVPALDTPDPALNNRLADVTGDGRLDLIQLRPLGDALQVQTVVLPEQGGAIPAPVNQVVPTQAVPLAGRDVAHWRVGDFGSPADPFRADGRADLQYTHADLAGNGPGTYGTLTLFSNGDGTYTPSGPSGPPAYTSDASSLQVQGDFNGDGLSDVVRAATTGSFAADLNGDGKTDVVTIDTSMSPAGVESQTAVASLGDVTPHEWPLPAAVAGRPARSWRPADLNGDGRTDLVSAIPDDAGFESVVGLLFTGSGWELQPQQFDQTLAAAHTAVQISDFNGDGCADLAWQNGASLLSPRVTWLINQCDGRLDRSDTTPARPSDTWALSWQPADLDGNGQDELLSFRRAGPFHFAGPHTVSIQRYASAESAGLLSGVDNGIGLSLSIRYGTTAGAFAPTRFGRTQFVVTALRFGPMSGSPGFESRYGYAGALWSGTRSFLGFSTVSVSSKRAGAATFNHHVVTAYEQTEGCSMQPRRTEVRGAGGLFWADTSTYNDTSRTLLDPTAPFATAPWICELERTARTGCELTTSCRETSVQVRHYDAYGNLTRLEGLGDPADARDDRSVWTRMAHPNIARYLVSLPFDVETRDASGGRLADVQTYYDGATSPATVPTVGNATRTEEWDPVLGYLTTRRVFDSAGNITSMTDPDGRKTTTKWDPTFARFPVRDCNALWCTTRTWDLVGGTKQSETDSNHQVVRSVYDALGRHRRTDFPDGSCLTHQYLSWGAQANRFDFAQQRVLERRCGPGSNNDVATGPWHATYFDGLQRPWRETRSGGYERQRTFDGWKSNPAAETAWKDLGGKDIWTRYHYDEAQRLQYTELPDSRRLLTTYEVGATLEQSPAGGVRRTIRDGWDRVASVSDDVLVGGARVASTSSYTYDGLDRIRTATDPNGHVTTWSWSPAGWLRSLCRPDTGCRTREFSRTGLVRSETDALGQRVEYTYDKIGRRKTRLQHNQAGALTETSTWTYDHRPGVPTERNLIGRVASVSSTSGTSETLSYDVMGRVSRRQTCVRATCVTVGFGWSMLGNLDTVTYPDPTGAISGASEVVHYRYDDANRVSQIDPYVPHITYDPDDRLQSLEFQNGVVQTFVNNPERRWVDEMHVSGPHGPISDWTYYYDDNGDLKSELRRGVVASQRVFKYDPSGRLLATIGPSPHEYQYDLAGNIVQDNGATFDYADPAHPDAVTHGAGSDFTYDANGNANSRNSTPLKWDALGRLVQAGSGPDEVDYLYTPDGALAEKTNAGGHTQYFGPYVEKLPDGTLATNYLRGDTVVARRDLANGVRFLHRDRLGSVTEVTGANGSAAELYDYDAWGKSGVRLGGDNEFRFATGREDKDTHLVRMGVRDLDTSVGRFISPDPLIANPATPMDLNPYAYARDNPLNITDPSGQAPPDELADENVNEVSEAIDRIKEALGKIIGATPLLPITELPPKDEVGTPKDPIDVLVGLVRGVVETAMPEIRLLSLPIYRPFGKGVGANFTAGLCAGPCLGQLEVGGGLYFSKPGPGDKYFGDVHLDFTLGGAFAAFTPGDPSDKNNIPGLPGQFSYGFGGGAGVSAFSYITQAGTREEHHEFSREFTGGALAASGSVSWNSAGQYTLGAGPSFSVGAGVAVYNSYTWTSGGVLQYLRGQLP